MPIFEQLNIEVDLRFEFDKDDQVKRVVPVAIAHFATDNEKVEFFVQFDSFGLDSVIEKLTQVRERMLKIGKVRIEHG